LSGSTKTLSNSGKKDVATNKRQKGKTAMTFPEPPKEAESLERLFETFAQTILAQMNTWAASEGMPQSVHQFVDFTEIGYRLRYAVKHEYWDLLLRYYDHPFWGQEAVEQFVRKQWSAMLASPTEVPLSAEEIQSLLYQDFLFPLLEVLEQYATFHPTLEQLLESYSRYQAMWAASSIRWDVIIPLVQFTSDLQEPVRFSSHLQLAPFTREEKTSVWNRGTKLDDLVGRFRPVDFNAFLKTRFKLTGFHIDTRNTFGNQELSTEVENIITALRLVKAGDVGVLAFFETNQMPRSSMPSSFISLPSDQSIRQPDSFYSLHFGSLYTLSETDLTVAQALSEALQKLDKQKSGLAVALRHFNQAYGRINHEDRIIDLTVALESCLLADVATEELNYRLALRGAALLAQAKLWEPEKAQALLKAMYAIRSAIVHAGRQLSDLRKEHRSMLQKLGIPPHEFPGRCENIVRDILRTYVMWLIQSNKSVQTICSDLDRSILRGLIQSASGAGGDAV
jgi:Apea-like HEPN